MQKKENEDTTPETVLIETIIVFGLVVLMKYLHRHMKSKSVIPMALTVAAGYYVIMFVVSRIRPSMCANIRNSITWSLGTTLGHL